MPHMKRLYGAAYRLTGDAADAEDLVQETLLRAYRRFHLFVPGSNAKAWLLTILQNLRTDLLRKKGRTPALSELPEEGPAVEATQGQGLDTADVERILSKLPDPFRTAVVLRDVEELSYEEIAKAMHAPIGTVMSRIHRGRALLRAALRGSRRMSCEPEKVTGYVDDALAPEEHAAVEVHLVECSSCRQQVEEERTCERGSAPCPRLEPRPAFEDQVRRRLAGHPRRGFWALPFAASLVALLALWARGAAPFVAYELARDHAHCFDRAALPAKVWSDDAAVVVAWFEGQGTSLPLIPENVAGLGLVGARYCPLLDRFAAHLYYTGGDRHASIFVLKGPARFRDAYEGRIGAQTVLLVPLRGNHGRDRLGTTRGCRGLPPQVHDDHRRARTRLALTRAVHFSSPRRLTAPKGVGILDLLRPSGAVAQLGARVNGIHEVTGSIPVSSTNSSNNLARRL